MRDKKENENVETNGYMASKFNVRGSDEIFENTTSCIVTVIESEKHM